ncbi:MAG: rhamnogalacturonan acetylesterase [Anaerolineae bacterium]|nr:rhamnogalacturonan acetylesterase [Anaerolineae bacterium]
MAATPITVYLAGDSTMAEKAPDKRPETGWGEFLQQYFPSDRVRVENHAQNGRSTRTFLSEGRWQAILDRLRPGDYVLIQFGHNDQPKEKVDRHTSPDEFRHNLTRFVQDVRAREATPVLLTPVMRRRFDAAGHFEDSHAEYPAIVRAVAQAHAVPLIDMHRASEEVIQRYGVEGSKRLFLWLGPNDNANYPDGIEDNTHFSPEGASAMAALAVQGIQWLGLGLADNLAQTVEGGRAT